MDVELLSLRNYFYIGDLDNVIKEAESLDDVDSKTGALRDAFLYRAHLAAGNFKEVTKNVGKSSPMGLQAVNLLATYQTAQEDQKELVFGTLQEWLEDPTMSQDATLQVVAAQIYFEAGMYKEALKLVHASESLEARAMTIQIYLKIDRVDLAEKTVKAMQQIDDDDTLTILASSWVSIAKGGDAVSNAFDSLNELIEKFGETIPILNSLAVCCIHQENYTDAFNYLKQARKLAIDRRIVVSADTLINTVVCLQLLNRPPSIVNRILDDLKKAHPNHPWLQQTKQLETIFDKHATDYQV